MWAISLLQAVRFCLRHVSEVKLKDKLGQLLDIYEELLEPEKIEYQGAVAPFLQKIEAGEKDNDRERTNLY